VIKGCIFLGVKNWQTLAAFEAGHYRTTRKHLEYRTQLDDPPVQEAIH